MTHGDLALALRDVGRQLRAASHPTVAAFGRLLLKCSEAEFAIAAVFAGKYSEGSELEPIRAALRGQADPADSSGDEVRVAVNEATAALDKLVRAISRGGL